MAGDWAAIEAKGKAFENEGHIEQTLCARCKNGTVYQRRDVLSVVVYCGNMRSRVHPDVQQCTGFEDKTRLSLYEMDDVALKIDDRKGINDQSYL